MPARKPVTEFMLALQKRVMESRGVAETTATEYINMLKQLNGGNSYSNLGFLKKKEEVMGRIQGYADSTQKSMLGALVSVLSLEKDKPTYKAVYNFYYERMMEASKKSRATDTAEKTETQDKNWITWEEVMKKHAELQAEVAPLIKQKLLTPANWNAILSYVLLSLYTLIPPRRNQDYQDLFIVKKWNDGMSKDKNYYDMATSKFIFNKYKTAKSHGSQELDISDNAPLKEVIALYIKLHPSKGKGEMRFLVNPDGSALSSVNSITRILNKAFGKHIGSSMLRHIYLSSKYKIEEMKADAEAMGHTLSQQKEYLKAE